MADDYDEYYNTEDMEEGEQPLAIKDILKSDNVADLLDQEELDEIASCVLQDLEEDEKSMADWLEYADKAMELTKLHREQKHMPFRNASNIKYPLITTAVVQFSSRTESELIKAGQVAKYKVIGRDPAGLKTRKGQRVRTHLNWQIMEKMPNWQNERDRLHHQLAVCGTSFVKTWYDPVEGVNRSEFIPYDQLIANNGIKSLETAPRISQYVYMSDNDLVEHMRWGLFTECDVDDLQKDNEDFEAIYHEIIEQHCFYDLDDDGLAEPYIVVVHKAAKKVLRIIPRFEKDDVLYNSKGQIKKIYPTQYFTDYHFIPNMDGSFYSLGFGTLLLDVNATINTILNQLINAGHLATTQGGFISKDLRLAKEDLDIDPGEFKYVETRDGAKIGDGVFMFNYKEPSNVLYSLLGTLVEGAKQLTSTTDIMTGTQDTTNTSPNTLMMLMQQGLKVYSAIQRRIFRSFKRELEKLVKLNAKHINVEEYIRLIDPTEQEIMEMFSPEGQLLDYDLGQVDIVPCVDPNESTEQEALVRAQAVLQAGVQLAQLQGVNPRAVARAYFESLEVPNIDQLVLPEPPPDAPNPAMIQLQLEQAKVQSDIQVKAQKTQIEAALAESTIQLNKANAYKAAKDADMKQDKVQLDVYKTALDHDIGLRDLSAKVQKDNLDAQNKNLEISQKAISDSIDKALTANQQKIDARDQTLNENSTGSSVGSVDSTSSDSTPSD